MTTAEADPDTTRPVGRYEWENVMRRLSDPKQLSDELQRAGLILATYADPDGTRVRPGEREFADALRKSKATAQRRVAELQALGFLQLVARGGGRGPGRRASDYRLTLPTDLLERFTVRSPGVVARRGITLVTPIDESEGSSGENSPQPRVRPVPAPSPVDNSETPITQAEASSDDGIQELPSNNAVTKKNSPQNHQELPSPMDEPHQPHTPTTTPTTTTPDPAQPQHARDSTPIELRPARCPHGLPAHRTTDGTPRCPLCRRQATAGGEPP